ncbi:MAG TPA: SRPBCC family protein [Candidatus Angelobacter sp.]|nr:SRPBCC family protein [Candidatus Angelobacter sp.]
MNRNSFWKGFAVGAVSGTATGIGLMVSWQALASARNSRIIRIEESLQIGRPVHEVFTAWSDLSNLPNITSLVRRVELFDRRSHWVMSLYGKRFEWDAELVQNIPNQALGWKSVSGPKHSGRINFSALDNDTLVHVTMNYAPRFRIFTRAAEPLREQLEGSVKRVLRDFKAALEHPAQIGTAGERLTGCFGIDPRTSGHTQHSRFGGTMEYSEQPEAQK